MYYIIDELCLTRYYYQITCHPHVISFYLITVQHDYKIYRIFYIYDICIYKNNNNNNFEIIVPPIQIYVLSIFIASLLPSATLLPHAPICMWMIDTIM